MKTRAGYFSLTCWSQITIQKTRFAILAKQFRNDNNDIKSRLSSNAQRLKRDKKYLNIHS